MGKTLAWAVPVLVLGVCAAIAATALLPRTWRERAAWRRITRANPDLEQRFAAIWEEDINRLAGEIGERLRRLREHLGPEGGDT